MIRAILGIAFLTSSQAQVVSPPSPEKVLVTDLKLATTPPVRAICVSGRGTNDDFRKATGSLAAYLIGREVIPGPAFSTFWKPGKDPQQPQNDAEWDSCIQVETTFKDVPDPFVLRDIAAQEAAHALCEGPPEKIPDCFSALFEFVANNHREPAAPPRYTLTKGTGASGTFSVFEVWLPLRPSTPPADIPKP